MNSIDKKQELPRPAPDEKENSEDVSKMDAHKKNPNPRANENLPEDIQSGKKESEDEGPGTEITDGEDG